MSTQTYDLIINHGIDEGYEKKSLEKTQYIRELSKLIEAPKKVFLGLGDFLEVFGGIDIIALREID